MPSNNSTIGRSLRRRFRLEGKICPGCGRGWDTLGVGASETGKEILTVDHMKPRIAGGTKRNNIVIVCFSCNQQKGEQYPWNWFDEQFLVYCDNREEILKGINGTPIHSLLSQNIENPTLEGKM